MNYILENYESIVREIKNRQLSVKQDIADSLDEWIFDNFLIYSILFKDAEGSLTYTIEKPLHSLHPDATEFENFPSDTTSKYNHLLAEIESELQLNDEVREYFWITHNSDTKLYIKIACDFLELTDNIRYFIYYSNVLRDENDKIENLIKSTVFKSKSEEKITQYIRKKQHAFYNFTSGLVKRINPESASNLYDISENYDKMDCLRLAFIFSEKLLTFLESEYNAFLNPYTKLSFKTVSATHYQLLHKMN